jgi:TRAP-type mannitol/chloroaromatic compound transport system permease large subunit
MATVGLPEMKRYNYADELAAGSVASGGGLGMIMPPSVVLIIYGVLTEQSIGKLFVAGQKYGPHFSEHKNAGNQHFRCRRSGAGRLKNSI